MDRPTAFLDRDGVLIADKHLMTDITQFEILPGVIDALNLLYKNNLHLIIVTNQTVVSRGLTTLDEALALNSALIAHLEKLANVTFTDSYLCPHHPEADVSEFRKICHCRKPSPGMLLRAQAEHGCDLEASWLFGDRPSDILAGQAAGCRTAWIQSGAHIQAPIQTSEPIDWDIHPDVTSPSLLDAVNTVWEKP